MAFDERITAENFPFMEDWDDFSNYLKAEGRESPCRLLTKDGDRRTMCISAE